MKKPKEATKLKNNLLQFSVVREDPMVEVEIFRKFGIQHPILIGSGGCTALALSTEFPGLQVALIEPNPAQVKIIKEKVKAVRGLSAAQLKKKFGVGQPTEEDLSLIERGNFESLFREFKHFVYEFVAEKKKIQVLLKTGSVKDWKDMFSHPYWPVAFDLFFSNSILLAMFGPAAIQHAPAESYSKYFRSVLEKGLVRRDRPDNYFLHHILLGNYLDQKKAWPLFLQKPPQEINIKFFPVMADKVNDYSPYDFVGLSNIFDWSSLGEIKTIAGKLNRELQVGSYVLYRQLNNSKDFRPLFGKDYQWLTQDSDRLHRNDRSLFYSSLHLARKLK